MINTNIIKCVRLGFDNIRSFFNIFASMVTFLLSLIRLAPPTNVPKPIPKSTTTTQVKPAVNSIKRNPALNSTNPNQRVPNKRAHPSRPNPAVGGTVITVVTTVSGIGSSAAVGQTATPHQPPFSEQPQNHQDNVPSDDDTSLSEDSDIDER